MTFEEKRKLYRKLAKASLASYPTNLGQVTSTHEFAEFYCSPKRARLSLTQRLKGREVPTPVDGAWKAKAEVKRKAEPVPSTSRRRRKK